ncbi:hypothetical protein C8R43DRAFT_1124529 [Mycena crocata]|nr:hypothetical protein C8R43DRAFT_1124529 [Mycena crocata]
MPGVLSKPTSISDLPKELLTEIWKLLRVHPRCLSRVTHVSKEWRSATEISSLWGILYITATTDVDQLSLWISRGKNSDLFIFLNFEHAADRMWLQRSPTDESQDPHSYVNLSPKVITILQLLIPSSPRWACFKIRGPDYLGLLLKKSLSITLPVPRLLHLSMLLEESPPAYPSSNLSDNDSLFHNTLHIPNLELSRYPVAWETFPFQTVTSLTLGPLSTALDWETFVVAITGSLQLVSITFTGAIPSIRATATHSTLVLPAVESMSLALLQQVELEHLTSHLSTPQLISLAVRLTDEDENFLPFVTSIPAVYPTLQTLAIEHLWLSTLHLCSINSFFTHFPTLTHLKLNFDQLDRAFWQALLCHASKATFLPSLKMVTLVETPLLSVQELLLLRKMAGKEVEAISIHQSSFAHSTTQERRRAWTTWIIDNSTEFTLTAGSRQPWVGGSGYMKVT